MIPFRLISIIPLYLLLLIAACAQEGGKPNIAEPEEKLLQVFVDELATIESYMNKPYDTYLEYQNSIFLKRIRWTIDLINAINTKYDAMTTDSRISYEEKWQHKFQPVIDDIDKKSRELATRATANMKPADIAKIESLQVKRENLEKKAPLVKLKPVFYRDP